MNDMQSVLITASFSPEALNAIKNALSPADVTVLSPKDRQGIDEALKTADVAIVQSDLDDQILTGKNLKWIHGCHAGLTKSAKPEVFERGILLTGSSGRNSPALAEHAVYFMLALTYNVKMLLSMQRDRNWGKIPEYGARTGLYGKTAGIIGVGNTGKELAVRLKAFGMRVVGYRRADKHAANFDAIYSADRGEAVELLLRESDYVVLCANLSDATYHLLNKERLSLMKPTAYLINMARGALVDEAAMTDALVNGRLAGAGLDAATVEPLPAESRLWDLPNVLITPHASPAFPEREERTVEILLNNIKAFREGKPMINTYSARDVYTK